jgi:hypothetical protein
MKTKAPLDLEYWLPVLDRLEALDRELKPWGLYAAEESQSATAAPLPRGVVEWEQAIRPALQDLGCPSGAARRGGLRFAPTSGAQWFELQAKGCLRSFALTRVSLVKVRRYGDTHRVDPHHDYPGRWTEAGVEPALNHLWDWRRYGTGVLVCLGFAPDARSLPALLDRLQSTTTFRQRHRPALVRTWADPHGRAFITTAALWQVPQSD